SARRGRRSIPFRAHFSPFAGSSGSVPSEEPTMNGIGPVRRHWLERTQHELATLSHEVGAALADKLDRMREQHAQLPYHIDAYRGMVDGSGQCRLAGRVLGRPQWGNAAAEDDWWDNLRNSYRRID